MSRNPAVLPPPIGYIGARGRGFARAPTIGRGTLRAGLQTPPRDGKRLRARSNLWDRGRARKSYRASCQSLQVALQGPLLLPPRHGRAHGKTLRRNKQPKERECPPAPGIRRRRNACNHGRHGGVEST